MYLSKIALKQFRSYEDNSFLFDKSLTLITGRNGIGKTNLLEAIYVLLQGSSFRIGDKDLMQESTTWWRLDGVIDGLERQVRYQLNQLPAKQIVSQEVAKRFTYKDRLPVVLFEPSELQLINGSPSRRRNTIDGMLSALSSNYKTTLARYERVLKQRNNALKQITPGLEDQLFSWDILLSEYGSKLLLQRYELIENLNKEIEAYYSEIAGRHEILQVRYISTFNGTVTPTQYLASLHSRRSIDIARGTTSVGPHRDDIEFLLRGNDARLGASRGEIRTLTLSLKMTFAHLLEEAYHTKPIILFDDVFSELDKERQKNVLKIASGYQVILTDTKTQKGFANIAL